MARSFLSIILIIERLLLDFCEISRTNLIINRSAMRTINDSKGSKAIEIGEFIFVWLWRTTDLRISALKHSRSVRHFGSLAGKRNKQDKCSPRVEVSCKYGRWKNRRKIDSCNVSITILYTLTTCPSQKETFEFALFLGNFHRVRTHVCARRDKSLGSSYKSELTSFRVLRWAIKRPLAGICICDDDDDARILGEKERPGAHR